MATPSSSQCPAPHAPPAWSAISDMCNLEPRRRSAASGAMLIELMVGMVVAALAISAAIASLLVARDATSAVNDMSRLQQQAAHAMRVLGSQIRPAGSLDLQAGGAGTTLFQFAPEAPALEGGAVVHGTEG